MSDALKKLQEDVKYETECWVEAARRTCIAKRSADDCAREESMMKSRAINAIEALTKHHQAAPTTKETP